MRETSWTATPVTVTVIAFLRRTIFPTSCPLSEIAEQQTEACFAWTQKAARTPSPSTSGTQQESPKRIEWVPELGSLQYFQLSDLNPPWSLAGTELQQQTAFSKSGSEI